MIRLENYVTWIAFSPFLLYSPKPILDTSRSTCVMILSPMFTWMGIATLWPASLLRWTMLIEKDAVVSSVINSELMLGGFQQVSTVDFIMCYYYFICFCWDHSNLIFNWCWCLSLSLFTATAFAYFMEMESHTHQSWPS